MYIHMYTYIHTHIHTHKSGAHARRNTVTDTLPRWSELEVRVVRVISRHTLL